MILTGRRVIMLSALGGSAAALTAGLVAYPTGVLNVALGHISRTAALVQGAVLDVMAVVDRITVDSVLAVLGVLVLPVAFVALAFVILGND